MGYKFNSKKYLTRGIDNSVAIPLQLFLWEVIYDLSLSEIELDYLQIFTITTTKSMINIEHQQEEPIAFKKDYKLFDEDLMQMDIKDTKIYVIDNVDYSIMLLASEY